MRSNGEVQRRAGIGRKQLERRKRFSGTHPLGRGTAPACPLEPVLDRMGGNGIKLKVPHQARKQTLLPSLANHQRDWHIRHHSRAFHGKVQLLRDHMAGKAGWR